MGFFVLSKELQQLAPHLLPEDAPFLCGLDEAGRGPWAGPVVAAACMFHSKIQLPGLDDSKKVSLQKREELYQKITTKAWTGVGQASEQEIDRLGLVKAVNKAFVRALEDLLKSNGGVHPKFLLIDGRDKLKLPYPFQSIIKGDEKVRLISAASIVAKVHRDRLMEDLAQQFPQYSFHEHKGYGTKKHRQALRQHGACTVHRKSFRPVRELSSAPRKPITQQSQ